jgi:hypothetical protein
LNKYRNKKTEVDGIRFDSVKEANRYCELKMLEKAGEIKDLVLQPKFQVIPKVQWGGVWQRERVYIADFQYKEKGNTIVEDVKSEHTRKNPVYTLKRQLFLLRYGHKYIFKEV